MIGRIAGKLLEKRPPQILVDVQGTGYEVDVPMGTFYNLPALGENVTLYTHLVVREDAHLLYGFGTEAERHAFRQMLKVSGVGPKLGLAVLSGLSVSELAQAIAMQETGRLVRVPGVGKKTAERLVLELRGKLEASPASATVRDGATGMGDVANALAALGYSSKEIDWAVQQLPAGAGVSDGIRQALKLLAKA